MTLRWRTSTDFLENGLYDPALVHFDPDSTTRTLEPNERDLTYSIYRRTSPRLAPAMAGCPAVAPGPTTTLFPVATWVWSSWT